MNMVEFAPDIFFESSAFPAAFRVALAALTLKHPPPKFPLYANAIHQAVDKEGFEFASLLMAGLVGDFPEEAASIIVTLFRVLASLWPNQLQQWATVILQGLPVTSAPEEAKVRFMKDLNEYVWTLFLPQ